MGQDASQEANNGCKKNFPAFYETRKFITVFTRACQLTLHKDQSSPHAQTSISKIYFNTVLPITQKVSQQAVSSCNFTALYAVFIHPMRTPCLAHHFLSLTSIYLLIVGVEGYCCT